MTNQNCLDRAFINHAGKIIMIHARQNDQLAGRAKIRSGTYCEYTSGLANGFLQVNLVIREKSYALDFMRFCQRNPKPCPLVGVTDT